MPLFAECSTRQGPSEVMVACRMRLCSPRSPQQRLTVSPGLERNARLGAADSIRISGRFTQEFRSRELISVPNLI